MARRLTTFSKFLITLVILAALVFAGRWVLNNTEFGKNLMNQAAAEEGEITKEDNDKSNVNTSPSNRPADDDVLKVQIFTWGGVAPGLYFNEGAQWSERSRFYTDYGLKVDFELLDDFGATRQGWIAGEFDVLSNEISAMNTEMEQLAPHKPRILMQYDWSRGGDAVVVGRGIKSVNDLRGKKVAYAGFTPSVTFLIFMLESANMTLADIEPVEVALPTDAATAFKGGQVDAAVIWSPDIPPCLRAVNGSQVLQSTKDASHIIADVFMVKDSYVRQNPDKLAKFYEGWMKAVAELENVASNQAKAAKICADVFGLPVEDATAMMTDVRFTTHGDNLNFFGLNTDYRGMTGEKLYVKMGEEFEKIKQAPAKRPIWRNMAYPAAVSAARNTLNGPGYLAEGQKEFAPAAPELIKKQAIATKPVTINFASGKSALTDDAKTIIDQQFSDVAQSYSNTRVRIEGNTDSDGSRDLNMRLSRKRAEAVAAYLTSAYGMNANRFIIVGNGPDNPVPGCENNQDSACKAKNRRTDFQLVTE